ncbi:MAG: Dam family site-specific DNA-(adenine-N6)-methyltransferase [Candidatus Poribacteria bacterium]|nr:Dam family site-specific DNA-(adenine-N6)-methyltransferase [Candidatus Poribacteria bacterium]
MINPFVKWAGGKRRLVPFISERLPESIATYHEPFAGGGAAFFAFDDLIERATLADLNAELVLTYHTIKTDVEPLIEALNRHAGNHHADSGYYNKVRKSEPAGAIEASARFLYLNRTCYNGLYRVNKSGKFNVPKGRYKNPNICDADNLRKASEVLQKATIKYGPFTRSIAPASGDFVYCDPPYDETFTNYQPAGFNKDDQVALKQMADTWAKAGARVMLSNADTPFIRDLYQSYTVHSLTAPRDINCTGDRSRAAEVLITTYE